MIKELKILYRNEQSSEESLKAYWSPRKLQVEFIFLISAKNNKLDFRQLEPHAITTFWWTFKIYFISRKRNLEPWVFGYYGWSFLVHLWGSWVEITSSNPSAGRDVLTRYPTRGHCTSLKFPVNIFQVFGCQNSEENLHLILSEHSQHFWRKCFLSAIFESNNSKLLKCFLYLKTTGYLTIIFRK